MAIGSTAKSYGQILGSNDRLNFAVIGLNGRAYAHLHRSRQTRTRPHLACLRCGWRHPEEVCRPTWSESWAMLPPAKRTFAIILQKKEVDAITIATPDHWHAPMAIAGLQAGKHVYVEKPCSHNPAEGAMLVEAQQKYNKLVQMGTQQRSRRTPSSRRQDSQRPDRQALLCKGWYSNTRKSIGIGKEAPVPPQLDWDLWQGPAPRRPYKDNIHPYNWHWFRIYGTGETLNNGTHEIDVCRWALGVDYPKRITSSGGRYHFKDDWQFYDTLVTSFDYGDKMISWEGKCCQGMKYYNRDRGSAIMGTTGLGAHRSRRLRGLRSQGKQEERSDGQSETCLVRPDRRDSMTDAHFANFIAAIRKGEKLNAPVSVGNVAVTMLQLSNIAWEVRLTYSDLHIR
jgi:predicted dehydrogenase